MRYTKRKIENGKENGHAPVCPHCGAGRNEKSVGLYWESDDRCWRCVVCGYRGYEHAIKPRTKAEIVAESLWDQVLDALDKEKSEQIVRERYKGCNDVRCEGLTTQS